MTIQITKGLLSVEQAMLDYNITSQEVVLQRVADFRLKNHPVTEQHSDFADLNVQAA